jgi:hypothetical protein
MSTDPRASVAAEIIGGWLHIEPFCCDDLVEQILEAIDAADAAAGIKRAAVPDA